MAERTEKHVSDSFTTQVQLLTQANLNGYSRLFGGQLMSWMDIVAAVTARRHAGTNVTTARVQNLSFRAPARANDTLVLTGEVVYTGRTSMDIRVCCYLELLDGEQELINEAFFTMVALDEHEKPVMIPRLIIDSEEQQRLWDEAAERRKTR